MRNQSTELTARSTVRTKERYPGEQWKTRLDVVKTINNLVQARDDVHRNPLGTKWKPPLAYVSSGNTSDYPAVSYTCVYRNWNGSGTWDVQVMGYLHDLISAPVVASIVSPNDKNRAVINMLRSVGDQKWSAGETLLEMQSSVDLIGTSARKLSNAMLAASKKNWKGVAKALDVAPKKVKSGASPASGWLEYQFGWAPVVSDIANAALFVGGAFDSMDPPIIMARTKIEDETVSKREGVFEQSFGIGVLQFPYLETVTMMEHYKASVYYTVALSQLRELTQYGLVGLSTPWALLPMSFVADWVVPIGDFFEALDATVGITYLGGSYTTFQRSVTSRMWRDPKGSVGTSQILGSIHSLDANRYRMERVVWKTSPFPSPMYIKNPFDTFKAVTSVALLKQFSSKQ